MAAQRRGQSLLALGPLECEVMDIIWRAADESRGGILGADVHTELLRRHGRRSYSYSTVNTTLARLTERKYLRANTAAKPFTYRPAKRRERVLGKMADQINGVIGSDQTYLVVIDP